VQSLAVALEDPRTAANAMSAKGKEGDPCANSKCNQRLGALKKRATRKTDVCEKCCAVQAALDRDVCRRAKVGRMQDKKKADAKPLTRQAEYDIFKAMEEGKPLTRQAEYDIFKAIEEGNLEGMRSMCSISPQNVNAMGKERLTPLHKAILFDQKAFEAVEVLLAGGADLRITDSGGEGPLHWVSHSNQHEVAQLLLEARAKVDAKDYFGYTPLYYAVISKHCRVAEVLLAGGADAEMSDYNGQTALDRATQLKHEAMLKVMETAASKKNLSANSWFHG